MLSKTSPSIRYLKSTILNILLIVLLSSCAWTSPSPTIININPSTQAAPVSTNTLPASTIIWPTMGWLTSSPAEQGMDPQKLADMLQAVQQKHINLHSLLVIRHGYIVSENYFQTYDKDMIHEIYSCTKSFISTLVGIAVDQGYIKRLDQKVLDFFPGQTFEDQNALKNSITLDDMLTMTSGLGWNESDATITDLYMSRNWAKFVLDLPMADQPRMKFNYCTGCTHVLSVVLNNAIGTDTRSFALKNLFEPLGIKDYFWMVDKAGIANGGWGLQLTSRDMAKLGYLYLHEGVWEGKKVVSQSWVKTATQKHVQTDGPLGYGYQWWVYPSYGAFTALGMEGQTIFVIPSMDLIIVTTAKIPDHQPIFDLIDQYIVPSIQTSN
jgi:CubicO group peptidase (beta-lactamase class C family)